MTFPVLVAVLLFVLPKTPPSPELKGWEKQSVVALPYAAACQHLTADLMTDGWCLVRTERIGAGAAVQEVRKYANARGATVIFLLWRIGSSATGYAYRRDRPPTAPKALPR